LPPLWGSSQIFPNLAARETKPDGAVLTMKGCTKAIQRAIVAAEDALKQGRRSFALLTLVTM
jgi:hypothetical protein